MSTLYLPLPVPSILMSLRHVIVWLKKKISLYPYLLPYLPLRTIVIYNYSNRVSYVELLCHPSLMFLPCISSSIFLVERHTVLLFLICLNDASFYGYALVCSWFISLDIKDMREGVCKHWDRCY